MTVVARNMGNQRVTEHLRGVLVGGYKTGKSWTLATAPDPVLIIDPDLRADSLSGKYGVYCLSLAEPAGLNQQPTVYSDVLKIIGQIEKSRRLGDIIPDLANDPRANENIKTLALDSIQSTSRAILQHNMYTNPKVLARTITVAGQNLLFPNGWDTWNSDMECLEQLIGRMVAIPDIDFWITFHEDEPKDGRVTLFPGRHKQIIRYFNEVWRMTRMNNVPDAQLAPSAGFAATTTLVNAPATVNNPNIKQLVAIYGKK